MILYTVQQFIKIGLKIYPLETLKKKSGISDSFRSKNSPENRFGAKSQKQKKSDRNPPARLEKRQRNL